ncbi:MAG: hypothetical protein Q7J78_03290 [Clostridiales bacterium]|nr:hypothetical protein [Clostridiales bacterium]
MKIEVNDAFKPLLESRIDGNTIKTISDALNLHLLKTLKPAKVEQKPGTKNDPAKP